MICLVNLKICSNGKQTLASRSYRLSGRKQVHAVSACANHREQFQKLLTRWYYTPLRLSKTFSSISPYCWRACGSVGSILHIFWSCTSLQPFWNNIFALISSITQQQCPKSPEFALLLIDIEAIPAAYSIMVCNVVHAARLSIARHWKTINPAIVGGGKQDNLQHLRSGEDSGVA